MTLIWPLKVTKGQTDYTIRFRSYELIHVVYGNYSAISHRNLVFSRWPWSDLSKSAKVKLILTIRSATYETSNTVFHTVTMALSRTETRFSADDLDLTFKVTKGQTGYMASDSHHMSFYSCSIVTIALSRTETLFFMQMTLIWPSKVTKGESDYTIWFASYDILYMFNSNYSAISHRNPVFYKMTLIWPFKVTKGQTDYTIRFASHELLSVFHSN